MREDRSRAANDALDALSPTEVQEVLGFLCAARPEAVLQAVADLARHREVVAQLRGRGPVTDDRGQVSALGGYVPQNR